MKRTVLILALLLTLAACDEGEPTNDTTTRTPWPQDSTTGPEVSGLNEDGLPSCGHDGSWVIDTAGEVVEGCRHVGSIRVTAPDVTFRNVVVAGTSIAPIIRNESTDLKVERSIVHSGRPAGDQPCAASVAYGNYTAVQSEFYGCADGLKVSGTVGLDRVYIHNLTRWCDPETGDCTHNDGIQHNDVAGIVKTVHLELIDSSVYMNSCISNRIIQAPNLVDSTFIITGNFFYGSHGLLNIDKLSDTSNTGVVRGNVFAGTSTVGPFSDNDAHTQAAPGLFTGIGVTNIDRSGNTFEDQVTPVPTDGKMSPYRCEATAPNPPTTTTTSTP